MRAKLQWPRGSQCKNTTHSERETTNENEKKKDRKIVSLINCDILGAFLWGRVWALGVDV